MRVVTPEGETIALGTTEAAPTIGITDFSVRKTDDFGVTTVVPRGFSRKLSVRLRVPFAEASTLQRRLAALRTTAATWIAGEGPQALTVRGFYREFEIDLATPPVSFATLSVEGLAEATTAPDDGSDPAATGASTMRVLVPALIGDAQLVASSVPEDDAPVWASGTTYPIGSKVIRAHRVWENAAAAAGDDPLALAGKWLDTGPTNRWAALDQALGTATTAAGSVAFTIANAGSIGAVALLDVVGATVRVQAAGYDRSQPAGMGSITFLDLPAASSVTVTVTGPGQVAVGTLLVGQLRGLGVTEAAPTAGITDFSKKDVDEFGEVTVVERAWAKRMAARALIRTEAVDRVFNRVAAVRATPCLWIGRDGMDVLTIYGFWRSFQIEHGNSVSKLSLEIEGLSEAAKLKPIAGAVDWPSVGDPDGTKPADNADVTADNVAKDTANLGGKPVADVLREISEEIAAAAADVDAILVQADTRATAIVAEAEERLDAAVAGADRRAQDAQGDADAALQTLNDPTSGALRRVTLLETALDDPTTGVYARIAATDSVLNTPTTGLAARVTELEGVAFGGGTGQDGFAARISGLELVVGDATKGLVQQANRLEVNSRAGGNLLVNSALPTLDGWIYSANPAGGQMLRNNPDGNYMIGGVENNVTLRAPTFAGIAIEAAGPTFAVRAGSFMQFHVLAHAHRCRPWATLAFYNAADDWVGYAGELIGAPGSGVGIDIGVWQRLGIPCYRVPAGAVKARVLLRIYDVSSDGYGWFTRPFATEVREGATEWVPYSPGSDRASIATINASVTNLTTVVGDANGGLVRRTSDLESTLTAPGVGVVAKLGSLEQVVTAAGSGLVSKVGTLELSVKTGGNLLTNTDFSIDSVGWGFISESGSVGRRDWPSGEWWPQGMHTLNIFQGNGGADRAGLWQQTVLGLDGTGHLQLSVWAASHRAYPSLWMDFTDDAGGQVAGFNAIFPVQNPGTGGLGGYGRHHLNVKVPAAARRVYVYLGKQGTLPGHGDSYAWFVRPQLAYVAGLEAPLVPYSPGSGEASLFTVNTRVLDVTQVVGDANGGLVKRTSDLETSLDAVGTGVKARIGAAERAISNADGTGLAQRTSTLETSASGSAATENANPDFSAWPSTTPSNPIGWVPWASGGNSTRSTETLGKGGYAMDRVADALDSGVCVPGVYLTGGWYVVSARVWRLSDSWAGAGVTWGGVGGSGLDFMRDRDNAGKIGNDDSGGVREWTKLVYIDPQWVAYRAFHAMDNWAALGFGAVTKSLRWLYCGIRKASDAEVRGNDASDQLERPGGVKARIDSAETTIADLPNRYAAASRTAALEAQVNFAADSGLQRTINARIEERAAAFADDRAGAVAETLRVLRGEYNGTKATVTEQAIVIADKLGAGTATFRYAAEAGGNVAEVTGFAGTGAASILRFRANTIILDGNVITTGSMNIDRVDAGSAARYGQSSWSGYAQPGLGQTTAIPWGLTLPGILPRGRFIWEYRASVVTNAGTQAPPGTHNGRPFYTRYLADEPGTGLIVSASDAQGNVYPARANASDPIRATTPFDAAFSAVVRRGSYDSGIVDDGDYYYRELSATWTVTAFYLAVTWIGV